ncbi:MAG: hypothetical protein L6Q54_02125 [Leptospiraceae bacterium]|nr:hypothetical protein [Leptospiraceae bacterium]MCK6380035.1 hypothetical protein [Leptospiraceae bacterium]NUM40759.1 hypothetical protein [Leptospiraceae bacterium]
MRTNSKPVLNFGKPDIFSVYSDAPVGIQKRIKAQTPPFAVLKYIFFSLAVLFFSPISILFFRNDVIENDNLLIITLGTVCAIFSLYSILIGIYLSKVKIPYLQEWKDKLGYIE